jgi:hypothetical protein
MVDLEILPSGLKEVLKDENTGLEVRIYYLECLAQATYLIIHENTAFIVDPRRDVDVFIKELTNNSLTLRGILETHFHADFVSGHNEMMQKTNATIYFGPTAGSRCKFPHYELMDGEVIEFTGRYDIKVVHTPGHTPESVVYLVTDKSQNGNPIMVCYNETNLINRYTSAILLLLIQHIYLDDIECNIPRVLYYWFSSKCICLCCDSTIYDIASYIKLMKLNLK